MGGQLGWGNPVIIPTQKGVKVDILPYIGNTCLFSVGYHAGSGLYSDHLFSFSIKGGIVKPIAESWYPLVIERVDGHVYLTQNQWGNMDLRIKTW